MGKFTECDDPRVDHQIQLQLGSVVEIIKENVPLVRSILLAGSFGRGEGSVEIVNNEVRPLKDYDIYVIVDRIPSKRCKHVLDRKIRSSLGLPESGTSKFSGFNVDIFFYTKLLLKLYLDITLWELKYASFLLYGEDVRPIIPWKIQDIPLSNGLRFLFEKATGLTVYFSEKYVSNGNIDEKRSRLLIYECFKTYVEIASVLCLAMKCYEPSYRKRLVLFQKKIKQGKPFLSQEVSHLVEYIIKGTEFKLNPEFGKVEESPVDLWFQTRDTLCEVLKYYFEVSLNVKVDSWTAYENEELRIAMAHNYYKPMVQAFLASLGIRSEFLTRIVNLLFLTYQKLQTVFYLLRKEKTLHLRPLFRLQSPLMTLYLTSIQVLFSLKRTGEVDVYYSQKAWRNLSNVIPTKRGHRLSWDDLRDHYRTAYQMHRGGAK